MTVIRRSLAALVFLGLPLAAQPAPTIAGVWAVHSIRVYKNLHTGDTTTVDETAQMTLRLRGDSIVGSWQWPTANGQSIRPVRGVLLTGGAARVQVELETPDDDGFFATLGRDIVEWIKANIHDMPTTIPVYEFTVRGDSLVGTRRTIVASDGTPSAGPRPFYALRAKN